MAVQVNGEMAAILQSSRFSSDFKIQMLDKQDSSYETTPEVADTEFTVAKILLIPMLQSIVSCCIIIIVLSS